MKKSVRDSKLNSRGKCKARRESKLKLGQRAVTKGSEKRNHKWSVCGADKGTFSDDKDVSADEKQKFCKWKIPQESCVITMCRVDETVCHNLKIDRWAAQGPRVTSQD